MKVTYKTLEGTFISKNVYFLIIPIIVIFFSCSEKKEIEKPNILICVLDDASAHFGAYGFDWVETSAFDRIAKRGLLFTNAYTPNAKYAPSRASLITGRNSWQLEQAANHVSNFPAKFKTFPEVLRENRYFTGKTGKGWGPGDPGTINGKKRELIAKSYNELKTKPWANQMSNEDYAANFDVFLEEAENKPWFFWYGSREPHRPYEFSSGAKSGKNISEIDSVPSFWPDNEVVRNDMLDYALEIEYADAHMGKMLNKLEEKGVLDNAIVIITSDHGMPFPRSKAQEYKISNHVPLAIMWGKGIKNPGRTINDMVSFIDFAPTILEITDIEYQTSGMHNSPGCSLTDIFYSEKEGQVNPERDMALIGKERHDYSRPNNQGYPIRGIISDEYLYLYNYDISLWPAGNPEIGYLDIDGSPTKTEILNLFRSGKEDKFWKWSMGKRETNQEFFDLKNDADCINYLAFDESLNQTMLKMRGRMKAMLEAQKDPRMFGNGDIFNTYGYSNDQAWNYYERFMAYEFSIEATNWVNPSDKEENDIN
jgi:arylsulfatase A-like enzyme